MSRLLCMLASIVILWKTDLDINIRDIANHIIPIIDHCQRRDAFIVHKLQGFFQWLVTARRCTSSALGAQLPRVSRVLDRN